MCIRQVESGGKSGKAGWPGGRHQARTKFRLHQAEIAFTRLPTNARPMFLVRTRGCHWFRGELWLQYNTAHRPSPSALCPPRVFKYRRALYKHSGFKKVACGCSNWTLVILPPGADSPNHLVRKTWYESQAGERDMMMILWQRFHWQTATLRELKSNLLCTFTAGLIAYIRNRNGLWA